MSNTPLFYQEWTGNAPNLQTFTDVTLRDLFAAFAIAGIYHDHVNKPSDIAKDAYAYADAMLAEREKKGAGQ